MVRGVGLVCVLFVLGATSVRAQPAGQPAAAGRGAVVGTVLDASSGLPIVGAMVQVVGQPKLRTETDLDGKFKLSVPPGTYDLRVSADLYKARVVSKVGVATGEPARADVSLAPNVPGNVQLVEVTGVREAAEETQLVKRKEAATMSETIGAETISKSTDSDAAEVVTRVTGVTVKDDKFIVVRGLNERYSSALLNGSRLPSTDPNRRVVPLDLFPADYIESLGLIKGYTPDLPGDFAGGLVDIRLADPPVELTYQIGVSMDFNTETTFQRYETYDGTWQDWFTLGDDFRSLPSIFGDSTINMMGMVPTTPQQRAYVASLNDNWNIDTATAPPNFSIDAAIGTSFGPFGFSLAPIYGWKFSVHRDEAINNPSETFTYDHSVFETQLGALLTTQYTLSPNHKLFGRALVNRQSTNDVLNGPGKNRDDPSVDVFSTATVYTANQLGFGQLEGRHHWSFVDVDWRGAWGPSSQDQPDSKYYVYDAIPGQPPTLLINAGTQPLRTFLTLDEFLQDYFVDATVPFKTRLPFTDVWSGLPAKLKGGIAYALRDRNALYREFTNRGNTTDLPDPTLPPDQIFIPSNYSTQGPLIFSESNFEPFDASQEIAAFYGMFDLPVIRDRVRLIAGARLEYSYLKTTGLNSDPDFGPIGETVETTINDLDPIPSVNLVYTPRDDMNVRANFSQTVSRPDFRELTPTRFATELGGRELQGNQFLTTAHIDNYDLRWEWFFTPLELASVGFFYKDLEDPIELVSAIETTNYIDLYVNADTATVWGFELEGRKDFAFAVPFVRRWSWLEGVAPRLADLQILANVSIVESEVEGFTPPPGSVIAPLPGSHRLPGQSPFTVNAALEYQDPKWGVFRLLYNTADDTIAAAGTDSDRNPMTDNLGDVITERRDQLDFVWLCDIELFGTPLTAKFGVENILNDAYRQTQQFNANQDLVSVVNDFRSGLTFKFGFTYSY
jgi:outer membrane receptor protein involved in Fe transport